MAFELPKLVDLTEDQLTILPSFVPDKDEEDIIKDMVDIRNDWVGHYNGDTKPFVDDIYIMSEFIHIMGGREDRVTEMRDFADSIEGLALA